MAAWHPLQKYLAAKPGGKKMKTILLFLIVLILANGCSQKPAVQTKQIRLSGSTTVSYVAQYWAEGYMTLRPDVAVYIEDSNSGEGLRALIEGEADIAMTSRLIRPQEASQMAARYRSIGISYLVAKDALSVYLHPTNPLRNLTMRQLVDIFSGQITNWKSLNGEARPVIPVVRPPGSGSNNYFRSYVLEGAEYGPNAVRVASSLDVIRYVEGHPGAIGYGGIAFGDSLIHPALNGIEATEENVLNDSYPLSRYLYLYTVDTPPAHIRDFINWIISPAGQAIVRQVGYIPLWPTR